MKQSISINRSVWKLTVKNVLYLLIFIGHATFADWATFRENPQLTGVTNTELSENPQLLWTFQAGDMIES
ncbi:MAG: hypothetical protein OXI24_16895, partial [Candidatus Poribacteria bacterium]|nr:hypothetical protein [Candidatus Poribacteria bacterium]